MRWSRRAYELLESRRCLSSVGWDGLGQGGASLSYYVGDVPASIDFSFVPLDGPGGTLAQAYLPDDVNFGRIAGDVQFDIDEHWEFGNAQRNAATDLLLVAVHEIGHALGLEHSDNPSSVMYPSVSPNSAFQGLSPGDVDAILELYAPRPIPLLGDVDDDGQLTTSDIDGLNEQLRKKVADTTFDLNRDGWFDSGDLVFVLQWGRYV